MLGSSASPAMAARPAKRHAAASAGAAKRVALTSATGGGAAEAPVRAQLTKILKTNQIKVIPQKKGGAPSDEPGWMSLGQKLKVDGFVQLSFDGGHGKQNVEISVRTGTDGSVVGSETFSVKGAPRKLAAVVARGFWKKLGSSVKQVSAASAGEAGGMPARDLAHEPEATPEKKPEPEATESEKPATSGETTMPATETKTEEPTKKEEEEPVKAATKPTAGLRHAAGEAPAAKEPALLVSLQGRYLNRSFAYTPSSAAATIGANSPTIGAEVMWFPITNFGVEVGGEFESWLKFLGKFPTTSADVHASLVFRLPLSFGDLYVHAGGFRHFFAATDDGSSNRQNLTLPDTVYLGARAGAGLRMRLTDAFSLTVDGDYRLVTSLSGGSFPITSSLYFPQAKAGPAFDGAITVAFRLTPILEAQAGGDIRRYVIDTKESGNRINASGATDQYLAGWVGVGGVFGGP
jgi:hypothetical protein